MVGRLCSAMRMWHRLAGLCALASRRQNGWLPYARIRIRSCGGSSATGPPRCKDLRYGSAWRKSSLRIPQRFMICCRLWRSSPAIAAA